MADFRKCYISSDSPAECQLQKEDYLECLHHTKENRMVQLQHEESKRAREVTRKGTSHALQLGLIDADSTNAASETKA